MVRGWVWVVLLVLSSACSDSARWTVTLPETTARSYVLSVSGPGLLEADVFVGTVSEPLILEYEIVVAGTRELELLLFESDLAELGLGGPGRLGVGDECQRSCQLVAPDALAFSAQLEPDDALEWKPTLRSDALAERLVPDFELICLSACVSFRVEEVFLPTEQNVEVSLATADGPDVILGLETGALFRLYPDRTVEKICDNGGEALVRGGTRGDGDDLWLLRAGDLARLDLNAQSAEAPCVLSSSTAPDYELAGGRFHSLGGGVRDDGGVEILIGDGQVLHRFDDGSWTRVGELPPSQESDSSVSWAPSGEAVFTNGGDTVLHLSAGGTRLERPPVPGAAWVVSALVPGVGYALGAIEHGLGFELGGTWESEIPPWWNKPGSMLEYGGGVFFTFNFGGFSQAYQGYGACPMDRVDWTAERAYRSARLGEQVVMADVVTGDARPSAVAVLVPRSRCE